MPADGVLVSTRHLRDVRVDPATRTVCIPEPIRGRRIAHVRIAAVGGDDAVELAPLRAVTPVLDTVAELPVARLRAASTTSRPVPVLFKARNALLGPLDDVAVDGEAGVGPGGPLPRGAVQSALTMSSTRSRASPKSIWLFSR